MKKVLILFLGFSLYSAVPLVSMDTPQSLTSIDTPQNNIVPQPVRVWKRSRTFLMAACFAAFSAVQAYDALLVGDMLAGTCFMPRTSDGRQACLEGHYLNSKYGNPDIYKRLLFSTIAAGALTLITYFFYKNL